MDREDLILAYAQNRLPEPEKSAFEQRLQTDPDMAAEVLALSGVREVFREDDDAVDPSTGWSRLEAAIDADMAGPANTNAPLRLPLWQVGGLIAASLALWQVAVVPTFGPVADPGFEAVSETTNAEVLQVMFSGSADLTTLTALLREVDGTIIDGPSAVGLYRIAFSSPEALETARANLAARPDVVDLVTVE
ncbi:MAG: hypothetical protein AB3N17_16850 [Tateyamaria sp.]